ncbi:MAG: hypothetical protein BGP10_12355 [Rhodanobacter sp. 68-29]|nr:DUF1566 domain-containing protein [Rhodanobacter sp.]ODV27979.1 MAG: hypothetical protein ABT19_00275 [Rhodanobacter sp. SCN 68-63]OJY60683.1 MAG: hypothetical protein BGP10_12355 [Rhodanobacter sp. 68-29]
MKRFTDNGDGTVTDTLTGLMWTKATVATGKTHKQAIAAAKKLDVAGHKDWRMPTVEELFLLADRSRIRPAIDVEAFPDTQNDWYWTSTDSAWAPSCAWIVSFSGGSASSGGRNYKACVRAVRVVSAGQ